MSLERQARAQHAPGNARKVRATQMRRRSSHGLTTELIELPRCSRPSTASQASRDTARALPARAVE